MLFLLLEPTVLTEASTFPSLVGSVYDLANILDHGALYIRKVSSLIDHNLFEILPVDNPQRVPPISWPKEVRVSPVPDWGRKLKEYREQHEEALSREKMEVKKKKVI